MSWTVADTAQSLPQRFQQQARLRPADQAIAGGSWEPSFTELDAAANRIAHDLLERCPGGGGQVALLLAHDAPLFAAALGVLKAGKTVVALNPSDPPARLGEIAAHVGPELVFTDARNRGLALSAGLPAERLLALPGRPDSSPHAAPEAAVDPDRPAFLIYTSGSTGRPKGVVQTHRNMLHNVLRHTNGLGVRSCDRVALLASLSGGQGVGTTWTTLLNGATLYPFAIMERGLAGLATWLEGQRITVLPASASVFRNFVRTLNGERVAGVRLVRLASEPAFRADFEAYRRHFPDSSVLANTMSSSEVGNITQCLLGPDADVREERLPIGRPAEGIEVLLLDDAGAEVGPGDTGEIVVRSDYLSPGYWRGDAVGAAGLFHSGDLGRRSEDGLLTFVGRRDLQVKVRGYRVELPEVELAIAARPEVAAAAVRADSTDGGDTRLTGYVVARPGRQLSAAGLRAALRDRLPGYAVPAAFVFSDSLPVTAHGKVDRDGLAGLAPSAESPSQPELGEAEESLVAIWREAFEVEGVDSDAGFLDLGGDSLLAAVIAARVHSVFDVEMDLRTFADNPTVRTMAELVERLRSADEHHDRPPLSSAPRGRPAPMSFAQERVWRSSHTPAGRLGHTMAVPFRIRGPLDVGALSRSIDHVAGRHEVLRTTFGERDGRPVQFVHPPAPVGLPLFDLRRMPDPEAHARGLLAQLGHRPFDLERGPLIRLALARVSGEEHWLLRVNHHVISDGWSWKVFFDELAQLYEPCRLGEPAPPLDELPVQYSDFAAWQRHHLGPGEPGYRQELDWWREVFQLDHEPLSLPPTRTRPPAGRVAPGVHWWGLEPELSLELDRVARSAGATYFMVRLAVFAAQLAIETGREDIVIGMYATNRRLTELQSLFGDFTNLAALRLRFCGSPSFREWLAHVRAVVLETSRHIDIPHAQLCEELAAEGVAIPEIRTVFGRTHALPTGRFGELEVEPLPSPLQLTPTGFTFLMDRTYETDRCNVYFDSASYDPAEVSTFVSRFKRLAAAVCAGPDVRLRDRPQD